VKLGSNLPPSRLADASAVGGANPFNVRASDELPLGFAKSVPAHSPEGRSVNPDRPGGSAKEISQGDRPGRSPRGSSFGLPLVPRGANTGATRACGHGEHRGSFSPQSLTLLLTQPQNSPPGRSRGRGRKCLKNRPIRQVGLLGLEPRTYGLKVRCSNQLSYSPTTILQGPAGQATGPQNGRKPLESRRNSAHVEPGGCPSKPHRIAQPRQRRLRDRGD
jgi:hypothetical protein